MEKFYLEKANINRNEQVIEYVEEHLKYNAEIAGCSGLDEGYKNYEEWLLKMKKLMKYSMIMISYYNVIYS